jgi:hypothetical protein
MCSRLTITFNLEKGRCPIRTWTWYNSSRSSFSGLSCSTDSPGMFGWVWKSIFLSPLVALNVASDVVPVVALDVTLGVILDVAPDVSLNVVCDVLTELYKAGCCESKISGAMVDNIIFVVRLSRCRKEENHSSVVRVRFLGTTIVVPVHLVPPLRWGFASPAKLVLCNIQINFFYSRC